MNHPGVTFPPKPSWNVQLKHFLKSLGNAWCDLPLFSPKSQKSCLFDCSFLTAPENFLSDYLNLIIYCLAIHLLTFRIRPEAPAFPLQSLQWLLSLGLRLEDGMNPSKSSNRLHNMFSFKQPCLLPPQAWMAFPWRLCKGTEISREAEGTEASSIPVRSSVPRIASFNLWHSEVCSCCLSDTLSPVCFYTLADFALQKALH